MLKNSNGTVVNIIGGFARTPDPDFMIGGAVNAAFASFNKALAGLGLRDDVNVNAIHPGITATRTTRLGIGFAVNAVPLHHPVRLAEDLLFLDHLSKGLSPR